VLGNLLRYRLNVIQLLHHVIIVSQLLVQVTIVGVVAVALPATELPIAAPPLVPACHAFAQLPLLSHLSCLRHTHMGPTSLEGQGLTTTSKVWFGWPLSGFLAPKTCQEAGGGEEALGGLGGPLGRPGVGFIWAALLGGPTTPSLHWPVASYQATPHSGSL